MSLIEVMRAILMILAWRNLLDGDFARVEPVSDRQLRVLVYGASSEVRGLVNNRNSSDLWWPRTRPVFRRGDGFSFHDEISFKPSLYRRSSLIFPSKIRIPRPRIPCHGLGAMGGSAGHH
ncbi:hypothetical protein LB503_006668 [Fusarium chuoi]|nr:hypothetical protein LB503_006668 [Fusarium chuoi]